MAPSSPAVPSVPVPIETLLPHRGFMLLLEAVLEYGDDGIVCRGRIAADHPLAAEGRAPAILGLEMGAQAAGLFEALRPGAGGHPAAPEDPEGGEPRLGYLVGIRRAHFDEPFLPVGRSLRVETRPTGALAALSLAEVTVWGGEDKGDSPLVRGTVSTYAL